jgi:hypothetical protein
MVAERNRNSMIQILFMFALVFGAFWIGISAFRTLTGLEKWELTKVVSYAILCAVLTVLVLVGIVILF